MDTAQLTPTKPVAAETSKPIPSRNSQPRLSSPRSQAQASAKMPK